MRLIYILLAVCFLYLTTVGAAIFQPDPGAPQHRLVEHRPGDPPPQPGNDGVSASRVPGALFADLERLARLVDITYCVGTTGISPPFSCASRCRDFPGLELASTWNTGVLMSDSCGYVAVDHGGGGREGAVVVAFRGTYSITNTIVDLSTVPQEYVPYPDPDGGGGGEGGGEGGRGNETEPRHRCANCTVHMGFLESWAQARKLVLPVLEGVRAEHPGYPVQLVGHSLGGAVALLAALELRVSLGWGDDVVVTTFGEPQAGNDGFVGFVDGVFGLDGDDDDGHDDPVPDLMARRRPYRRVTHADDPVPRLPLSEWGFRSHAGEVFIAKRDLSPGPEDLRLCRGDEDPACIAGEDTTSTTAALLTTAGAEALDELSPEERAGDGWLDGLSGLPSRLKLWQLFFAHRDYFWRLGLCVPGGDPSDWGRPPYNISSHSDEL